MYDILVKLMVISALTELGITVLDFESCVTRECSNRLEQYSRNVLRVNWKAIAVFPEEAKRFREREKKGLEQMLEQEKIEFSQR